MIGNSAELQCYALHGGMGFLILTVCEMDAFFLLGLGWCGVLGFRVQGSGLHLHSKDIQHTGTLCLQLDHHFPQT